jgi:nucleoid-associated protein YgaU
MEGLLKEWLKRFKLSESTISMILGALVVIVVGVLIFNYFNQGQPSEEIPLEEMTLEEGELLGEESVLPKKYTVQTGDDLWQLATKYYNDGFKWPEIAKANNLKDPNLITPGQELSMPDIESAVEKLEETQEPITSEKYVVSKGDSLWFIALRAYGDPYRWSEIAKANKLVNPDLIHPGNEFVLPR